MSQTLPVMNVPSAHSSLLPYCVVWSDVQGSCVWAGGQEEAHEAYADAVNAIFVLHVDCHRHTQPHAQQQGKIRWEMIEMWPMKVSP